MRPINTRGFIASVEAKIMPELLAAAVGIQETAKTIVVESGHVDTGDLLNQIGDPELDSDNELIFGYNVISRSPHSIYVELGRAPGGKMPPHDAILAWVERKLGLTGREAESVTWAIKKDIQQFGIAPLYFMRQGAQSVPIGELERDISEALKR